MASNGDKPQAARSITAAAKRVPVREQNASSGSALKRTAATWQKEGWVYFDDLPEVKSVARFVGNSLSRLRLYPAVALDADGAPVPLDAAVAVEDSGIPADLAEAAAAEWARLEGGDGMASIQREFGICFTIPGECHLVGRDDENGEETWGIFSSSALDTHDGVLAIKETPGGKPTPLGDDDFVARIWRRHSQWPGLADSNMRAVLDVCEEMMIYGRQFRAIGKSRNNAGLLLIPNELDFAEMPRTAPTVEEVDGEDVPEPDPEDVAPASDADDLTKLERDLIESMVTPTADESSASSVVPHVLRGPADALEKVRHLALDRKIDEQAIARMVHLIGRLAQGMDVPVEILIGMADANHWTAWQIEDTTYKAHIEPLAQVLAQALASVFLRPALRERGFSPELVRRVIIGIDPSQLVVRPNRAVDAKDAYDKQVISAAALRDHLGFADTDAPTEEELLRRYVLERGIGSAVLTRDVLRAIGYEKEVPEGEAAEEPTEGEGGDGEGDNSGGGEGGGETTPESEPGGTTSAVVTLLAAATSQSQLGETLVGIDARIRERIQLAASAALSEALARAGKRLRAKAQGDPELSERAAGTPNERVGEAIGEEDAARLGSVEELLGPDDFAQLHGAFLAWLARARAEGELAVRRDAASRGISEESVSEAASSELSGAEDDDEAAWLLLLGALLTLGRARIFTPDGTPDDGEFDPNVAVPAGLVRDAMARAGGALGEVGAPSATGLGAASGGPASGSRMLRFVARLGAVQVAWRWEVGLPAVPFPPHHALAGLVFRSFDDPQLTNSGSFPRGGFYHPGDHRGCQCDAVPILVWEAVAQAA